MKEARHKRSQSEWFPLYKVFRIGKFIESESRLMVARGLGMEGRRGGYLMDVGCSLGNDLKSFETRERYCTMLHSVV